jgi:hypothetical protein
MDGDPRLTPMRMSVTLIDNLIFVPIKKVLDRISLLHYH